MRRWLATAVLGGSLAVACGGGPAPERPPDIQYGIDECSHCRMIISDERFAAASFAHDGQVRRFDDIACLAAHRQGQGGEDAVAWVHDHTTRQWLQAEAAWFVRLKDLATPMGSGLVACSTRRQAGRLATEPGAVYQWEGLLTAAAGRR